MRAQTEIVTTTAPTPSLSGVILTFNEEGNIERCLNALSWIPELILVDSFSTDNTLAIAKRVRPNIRVYQHAFLDFGDQRNWALTETGVRESWVLFVDADEVCTPALAQAITSELSASRPMVGYYLCYRNIFLGRWLRHCTSYPTWQLRLLRLGSVTFRKEGHGQREITSGPLDYIREPYDHFAFSKGIAGWMDRHLRYAPDEALRLLQLQREPLKLVDGFSRDPIRRRRASARLFSHLPFRPLLRFLYLYVVRAGFLDGRPGLLFCMLNFSYRIQIEALLAELEEKSNNP